MRVLNIDDETASMYTWAGADNDRNRYFFKTACAEKTSIDSILIPGRCGTISFQFLSDASATDAVTTRKLCVTE